MIEPTSGVELTSDAASDDGGDAGFFTARCSFEDPVHVVELTGDLDVASRLAAFDACTSAGLLHVVVDMSGLQFMDCAGYGALAAASSLLDRRGGSLSLIDPVGSPRRLLELIDELGLSMRRTVRSPQPLGLRPSD